MRKLTTALLIVIGLIFCVDNRSYSMSLTEGIYKKQFNVITITRNKVAKYDEPLLLNEIFVLFKNIDVMLGGFCFNPKYTDTALKYVSDFYGNNLMHIAVKHGSNQHITTYYSSLYSKLIGDEIKRNQIFELLKTSLNCPSALEFQSEICEIFFKMNQALTQKIKAQKITDCDFDKPTLLVFQEAIFSQTHLLNDEHINFIIDLCKKLTLSYNVSIHINLLHQFDNNKCPSWITGAVSVEKDINSTGIDTGTTVANYSLIISKGKIANVCIKTEHDDTLQDGTPDLLIKEKFRLKSGTLKSHDLLHGFHFSRFIATRVCADMNSLAGHSEYDFSLNNLDSEGILIIQSNIFSLFNVIGMLNSLIGKNDAVVSSYLNRFIVHCDPGSGASVFKIIKEDSLNLLAYLPIGLQWPQYKKEYSTDSRTSSGIEVDVNSENCDRQINSKLFYINVWPSIGESPKIHKFEEKDL